MYEKHFGLKSRPFRSNLDASAIFVGPAQVKVMANLKKALAAPDAVVSVTGVVGVGKTTVVNRALEAVASKRTVARVGRMQLAADEVLELLLTEFNVSRQPNGTIQRFAAFKRLLHDWAAGGTRAFIIVEDAERIGNDALIELEALTAADSGDSSGASIVLMGQPSLAERLALPELARLKQRMRLRQTIVPFSAAEVQGYLKHCIRAAGGDFDSIFDPGAIDMLYRCSEGVPRVINNLCESVLAAAADAGARLVMPQLVQHVASEEFGLQPSLPPAIRSRAARKPEPDIEPPVPRTIVPQAARADAAARRAASPPVVPESKPKAAAPAAAGADKKAPATTRPEAQTAPALVEDVLTEFEPVPVAAFTPDPEPRRTPVMDSPVASGKAADATTKAAAAVPADDTARQKVVAAAGTGKHEPATRADAVPHKAQGITVTAKQEPQALAVAATEQRPPAAGPESGELRLEDIPELIQDTQPELVALPAGQDLPDLTDLVMPAKGNGAAKSSMKDKTKVSATTPASEDIPTLTGDCRIDTAAAARPAQPRPPDTRPAKPEAKPSAPPKPVTKATAASETKPVQPAAAPAPAIEQAVSKADTTITEIPAWDRDPTLAELKPDIEALEAALAVVPEASVKPQPKAEPKASAPPAAVKPKGKGAMPNFELPEITLEKELQVKEIEAQELLRKSSPPDTHEVDLEVQVKRKHGFDLDRLAEELGKARSLEDVDDKLAETLFGEEMAQAAAEVAALVAADTAAKEQVAKDDAGPARPAVPAPAAHKPDAIVPQASTPLQTHGRAAAASAGTAQSGAKRVTSRTGTAEPPPVPAVKTAAGGKSYARPVGPAVEITLGNQPDPAPEASAPTPEPIENQFGTSMTATLKALSAAQMNQMDSAAEDDDPDESGPDDKEKPSRRLFGLFRSSS